jgi:hypothetical protein
MWNKLLSIILILLFAMPVYAQEPIQLAFAPMMAAGGGSGAAACTPDSGDTYNQSFEAGTEPATSWSHTGTAYDYGYPRPGSATPSQLCSKSLRINPTADTAYVQYDYGSNVTDIYFRFYAYVTTVPGAMFYMSPGTTPTTQTVATITFLTDSTNWRIRLDGTANTAFISGLSYNTWYLIEGHVISNSTLTLKVNGTGAATTGTGANYNMRYFTIGRAAAVTSDIYIDEFALSTSDWIGAP